MIMVCCGRGVTQATITFGAPYVRRYHHCQNRLYQRLPLLRSLTGVLGQETRLNNEQRKIKKEYRDDRAAAL